jgi:hypothetical protein
MAPEFTTQADVGKTGGRRPEPRLHRTSGAVCAVPDAEQASSPRWREGLRRQDRPIRSVLIAAGVSVVIGALIYRR